MPDCVTPGHDSGYASPSSMERALRLMVYDRTCRGRAGLPGLSSAWAVGARLYRRSGKLDAYLGAASWQEALEWLVSFRAGEPIGEVQYWGHGKWGELHLRRERLDERALCRGHCHYNSLSAISKRMPETARWWFRTCETLGAARGKRLARSFTDFFGCSAAGHTFVIGYWQSGLHLLRPGAEPAWPDDEGLAEGTPDSPRRARWSTPAQPNTISCLQGDIPAHFA